MTHTSADGSMRSRPSGEGRLPFYICVHDKHGDRFLGIPGSGWVAPKMYLLGRRYREGFFLFLNSISILLRRHACRSQRDRLHYARTLARPLRGHHARSGSRMSAVAVWIPNSLKKIHHKKVRPRVYVCAREEREYTRRRMRLVSRGQIAGAALLSTGS